MLFKIRLLTWGVVLAILWFILIGFYGQVHQTPDSLNLLDRRGNLDSENSLLVVNTSFSVRRQDYSCGPGRPCTNGACCGKSGFCGYGDAYCGDGCISNCNAHAECGKYSSPPGTTCPLNACCSEFGFCGTTTDFCTGKCQSNCVLDPSPPNGSAKNSTLKRVIGYYQSWNYRSTCNPKSPNDLPLSELTHLNYAFAYISPGSYELVIMDQGAPESLYKLTTDSRQYNRNLKIFISVGGWAFSDNGTTTQPLFGEISSSQENQQKFAQNVVKFLELHGFDGLDIDWEYPGAPDRGGRPEDTENFVSLMRTLRQTFNGSPRQLGLTFTAPSSYWYLRWFDLPSLMKYADWLNFMTYDLHGTWDQNNPIGAIVQGHTNLTEIKLAAQLLWRVGVNPDQVSLGVGFYGRSFELADPGCSIPGCPFHGSARPGSCSATSGVLDYYEIQAILKQMPDLKPIYDTEAAVKYLVFDKTQWVSYDDAQTFATKVAWADSIGIGGTFIWAGDTDDDNYTAMSGLLGKTVSHVDIEQHALSFTQTSVAQNMVGENGQYCKVLTDRTCRDSSDLKCEDGFQLVGWDRNGCSNGNQGVPICCPQATAPKNCQWRGSGGDCNGQCHIGEATLFKSSWGGGYKAQSGTGKCGRGTKVFCCEAGDWKDVIRGCYWTGCGGSCSSSTKQVSWAYGSCMNYQRRSLGPAPPPDSQVEHIVPLLIVSRFASVANWGRNWPPTNLLEGAVPTGAPTRTPAIGATFWQLVWNNDEGLAPYLPLVTPNSPDLRNPAARIYEVLGSIDNPSHLTLLQTAVNSAKGQFECFNRPMSETTLRRHVREALGGSDNAITAFMSPLRQAIAVFTYLQDSDIASRMETIVASVTEQMQLIEHYSSGSRGLTAHWMEFYPFYFRQVSQFARDFVSNQIRIIRGMYEAEGMYKRESVLRELQDIEDQIPNLRYPFED
ncbi:hypothetical protein ANO14919_074890 [Xylariales sp. No.14919]|nr:hypothetical protein ANO14919_074890 [Xylariales sp. No.14919]